MYFHNKFHVPSILNPNRPIYFARSPCFMFHRTYKTTYYYTIIHNPTLNEAGVSHLGSSHGCHVGILFISVTATLGVASKSMTFTPSFVTIYQSTGTPTVKWEFQCHELYLGQTFTFRKQINKEIPAWRFLAILFLYRPKRRLTNRFSICTMIFW